MTDFDRAPLYVAAYDLTQDVFACAGRLPRHHRSVLARHLQESAFEALTAITLALRSRAARVERLSHADAALMKLRLAIRLGHDVGVIGARSARSLGERVDDIGRQIGGWQRSMASNVASGMISDMASSMP